MRDCHLWTFIAAAVLLFQGSSAAADLPSWTYQQTDAQWAALRASDNSLPYAICTAGKEQSPIDLVNPVTDSSLAPLRLAWGAFLSYSVVNVHGHTIQVDQTAAQAPRFIDPNTGTEYFLKQFHFHSPSDHTWSGSYRDMEVHFVHQALGGALLVVGVSFQSQLYGSNAFLNQFWTTLASLATDNARVARAVALNFTDALPVNPGYMTYPGSLTTPPCSESVTWYVMEDAIQVSVDQLRAFRQALELSATNPTTFEVFGNSRRTQKIESRTLRRFVENPAPVIDENNMKSKPGQVATAAVVFAVIGFVIAVTVLGIAVVQYLPKLGASSVATDKIELREKPSKKSSQQVIPTPTAV
jgi:carbonic anhydrase